MNTSSTSAQEDAKAADKDVVRCITQNKSFLVEAGAGSGKTSSLIEALKYLIKSREGELVRNHQQVACITFTNVAADVVKSRIDKHPAVWVSTIHNFCWSLIGRFQEFLREDFKRAYENGELSKVWRDKIEESNGINNQKITYDEFAYRNIDDEEIKLHHDDVLLFMGRFLGNEKFCSVLSSRFPVLLIDEYQDTNATLAKALKEKLIDKKVGPLIGFFGDSWQKIYGDGCGSVEDEESNLEVITKKSNFRSKRLIVEALSKIREELRQKVGRADAEGGTIKVFYTNNYSGPEPRLTGLHTKGDLPAEAARRYLNHLQNQLQVEGWEMPSEKIKSEQTKILMLTHRALATELGYESLPQVFEYNDSFAKKEDIHIAFMVDELEPACQAYKDEHYGKMFLALGRKTPLMQSHKEKEEWKASMDALLDLRENGTVGEVIEHLQKTKKLRLPEKVENREKDLKKYLKEKENKKPNEEEVEEKRYLEELKALRTVSYKEIIALSKFIEEYTPFSTKHGTKGDEYDNVLVVFGRGWNQYNFGQFLKWEHGGIPSGKEKTFERNRNLFYVVCSRAKENLCLLFTQELCDEAIETLKKWFGEEAVSELPDLLDLKTKGEHIG